MDEYVLPDFPMPYTPFARRMVAQEIELQRELQICVVYGLPEAQVRELHAAAVHIPCSIPEYVTPAEVIRTIRRRWEREGVYVIGNLMAVFHEERLRERFGL